MRPQIRAFIYKKSSALDNHKINADSLRQIFKKELLREKISGTDLEGILVLVMVKTSLNTDEELKEIVMAISRGELKITKRPASSRSIAVNNQSNGLSGDEMEDIAKAKLQGLMNQKSQIALQTNPLIGGISGVEDTIIHHLK